MKCITKGKQCFLDFHSDEFYGLVRTNATLFDGKTMKDWKLPSKRAMARNAKYIKNLTKSKEAN